MKKILRRQVVSAVALMGVLVSSNSCASEPIPGPDPFKPRLYQLVHVDNGKLPAIVIYYETDCCGPVYAYVDSATLIPYALGRPADKRLVDDRSGNGSSGGNTRDTSTIRGQMIDLKILRTPQGRVRDSMIVDVVLKDTLFIITRPHQDPARVIVDTGYYQHQLLNVPSTIDLNRHGLFERQKRFLQYLITR